ncbi:MAG: hypothetical protein OEV49_12650 [candidate division Zixibacteria bacterium]|nr:hypothetical protein [candidate division Zixibacteria bacterium]MDH3936985.1 hypothetical protein [candidate division Zixibacteria bacterium]
MEKEVGAIKFTETDDGVRIDIKGKGLKDLCNCGCVPMMAFGFKGGSAECCSPEDEKAEEK